MDINEVKENPIPQNDKKDNKDWYINNVLCESACPLDIRIENIIDYLSQDKIEKSVNLMLDKNPFPSITGRLCRYLCEESCIRKNLNSPVKIQEIEKYIGDYSLDNPEGINNLSATDNGKKILIIGAGLSGLSCAYFLKRVGFNVTVYEKEKIAWGKLNYFPNFELEKEILEKELVKLDKLGIVINYSKNVTKDEIKNNLIDKYDAIVTATGTDIIKEENYDDFNIIDAIDLLTNQSEDIKNSFENKRVVIVGINDFGLLAGRIAVRYKAKSVEMYYKSSKSNIFSADKYLRKARQEGIRMNYFRKIKSLIRNSQGIINRVEIVKTKNSIRDNELEEINGSEFNVEADKIIYADYKEETEENNIVKETDIRNIDHPKVFDFNSIPLYNKNVLDVIVNSKDISNRICEFLSVNIDSKEKKRNYVKVTGLKRKENEAYNTKSVKNKEMSLAKRVLTFEPVKKTYTEEQIKKECQRCFRCSHQIKIVDIDKCIDCGICVDVCPTEVFKQSLTTHPFIEQYQNNSIEMINSLIGLSANKSYDYSSEYQPYIKSISKCVRCLKCVVNCPVNIIEVNRIVLKD